MPLGLVGALVKDEAQKWIALTPTAVCCCRNNYCLQQYMKPSQKGEYLQLHSEKIIRIKENDEGF